MLRSKWVKRGEMAVSQQPPIGAVNPTNAEEAK